jgi:Calcineurin-like phosphoesterase
MSHTRVYIPDSHGAHIDLPARDAFLKDLKILAPKEIVWLGDHVDCGGVFSSHARSYTNELTESYEDDCAAANDFVDLVTERAPKTEQLMLEGNHEGRIERWVASNLSSARDAEAMLERIGVAKVLDLKARGIRYFKRSVCYMNISIPGTIKTGKCYATHGISASKHAADAHLARFGDSVVFGHVHRSMSVIERSVTKSAYGAWCPGTLAKLQPLYMHTAPTSWSHGYGVQFVEANGSFMHINVPIVKGVSLLSSLIRRMRP